MNLQSKVFKNVHIIHKQSQILLKDFENTLEKAKKLNKDSLAIKFMHLKLSIFLENNKKIFHIAPSKSS